MQYDEFIALLEQGECPSACSPWLEALWHDARGDWDRAHLIVQAMDATTAARIHAYLHRREGDDWNAGYWHRRAGSMFPEGMTLDEEWDMLVRMLTE